MFIKLQSFHVLEQIMSLEFNKLILYKYYSYDTSTLLLGLYMGH
jgi:hypothetical protein